MYLLIIFQYSHYQLPDWTAKFKSVNLSFIFMTLQGWIEQLVISITYLRIGYQCYQIIKVNSLISFASCSHYQFLPHTMCTTLLSFYTDTNCLALSHDDFLLSTNPRFFPLTSQLSGGPHQSWVDMRAPKKNIYPSTMPAQLANQTLLHRDFPITA